MATWKDYLKVYETKGAAAAWKFAQSNFTKGSLDYESARKFHAPNKADRHETFNRQAAIKKVSRREIVENCRFEGLPKL